LSTGLSDSQTELHAATALFSSLQLHNERHCDISTTCVNNIFTFSHSTADWHALGFNVDLYSRQQTATPLGNVLGLQTQLKLSGVFNKQGQLRMDKMLRD
jgi:hypothetical protein